MTRELHGGCRPPLPNAFSAASSLDVPFRITCDPPYLIAEFREPQVMLSWAMTHPGFQRCRKVVWLEVRNADLPPNLDPFTFLDERMSLAGHADAVALMTSRDIRWHHVKQAEAGAVSAACLATVGLSNGVRVGRRQLPANPVGTINILVHVSCALSQAALIETIAIAAQARTAAILALDHRLHGEAVSGTGTDCIVVAAPEGGEAARFAGLHTPIGESVGSAVFAAVLEGGALWCRQRKASGYPASSHNPQPDPTAC
jgi:adenosylcobinamide amidohydrolase